MQKLLLMVRDYCAGMLALVVVLGLLLLVLVAEVAWLLFCFVVLAAAMVWQLWLVVIGEE